MNLLKQVSPARRRIHSMAHSTGRSALEAVLLTLLVGWVLITWRYPAGDFLNNAWAPARLLWLGGSPYDQATAAHLLAGHTTQPVLRAMWTPLALPVFLPLSFIPPATAANLWFLAHFGWLFLAITLPVLRQDAFAGGWMRALPLLLFPPALNGLMLGQVTAFIVVLLLAGTLAARQGRPRLAGFLMAGALIKPQLTPLVFLMMGMWALRQGCVRQILAGGLAGLGGGLAVVIIWRPALLREYGAALQSNPRWLHATLPAIASEATGNMLAGLVVWLLATAVVLWNGSLLAATPLLIRHRLDAGTDPVGQPLRMELGSGAPAAADGRNNTGGARVERSHLVGRDRPGCRWLSLDRFASAECQSHVYLGAIRCTRPGLGGAEEVRLE